MMQSFRASPVFVIAVLVVLGLAGLNGLMVLLMQLQPGFLGMAHFTDLSHRTHDLTFGFLFTTAAVGMLAQLRRPSKNVAGILMALIPWVGLALTLILTFVLANNTNVLQLAWFPAAASTLIAAVLHPTGRDFFHSFSVSRVNWVMLALVIIAAVPLLAFASTNIRLQATITDDHAGLGHYGFMAAFGFTIIGVGLLASLRPDGWRLTAWVAGLLPALLGVISVMYPEVSSSLGLFWAFAAIAWGVVFVAAAERTRYAGLSADDTRARPDRELTTSTPRWLNVIGGIALVVVIAPVILFITGAPGAHTPPGGAGIHGATSSVADDAVVIAMTADNFAFAPHKITVTAGGDVAIVLTSVDILHDFVIDELDAHIHAGQGETVTGGFRAGRPGRYTFYCSVSGHREAGMEGTLIVEGLDDSTPADDPDNHTPPWWVPEH